MRLASPTPKDYVDVQVPEGDGWRRTTCVIVTDDAHAGVLRTPGGVIRYDPDTGKRR